MSDIFTTPDDGGDLKASDFTTSMTDRLGAQWADTIDPKDSLSGMWLARRAREADAGGTDQAVGAAGDLDVYSWEPLEQRQAVIDARRAAIPDIGQDDAKAMVKQEGLTDQDVHLGDAPSHKLPVLRMQIAEAHTRRDRQAAISRGPQGFFPDALGAVTSIGVGMIDPVNAAAFSIPALGEARMGKIVASAGDSILARGAARFGQGAAQGAVGTAVLQPADWWLHTQDGQDYTMAQAMQSIIMGAGMGGAFHAGAGAFGDIRSRWRGEPLAGSPQDLLLRGLMTGTHVHAASLGEEGVSLEDVPGIGPVVAPPPVEIGPVHPADVLADLPPAARQDAVHAAMADILAGRPTQAAEMLNVAADHDPRIAESFNAWHGSPHDFDRFDASKLGTGEGAQSYGHGLYFAENEKVARSYQRATSDKAFVNKVAEVYDEGHSPDDAWAEIKDNWKDFTPAEQRLMTALEKDDWLGFDYPHQAVSAALRDIKAFDVSPETAAAARAVGHMYLVKITANHDHFLDWDKPLSEQSEQVRAAIEKLVDDHRLFRGGAITGEQLYEHLADELKTMKKSAPDKNGFYKFDKGHSTASRVLHEAGIPGIKYLDQGSRGMDTDPARLRQNAENWRENLQSREAELKQHPDDASRQHAVEDARRRLERAEKEASGAVGPTRNFVVFDDKHIEITHKNGEPFKREELIAEHNARQAATKARRGRAAADPATWSLFEHLASEGGLKPDPELRAIFGNDRGPFVPGFGPLLRKTGMSLDDALMTAKEGGYFIDPTDPAHAPAGAVGPEMQGREATFGIRDLLDKIDVESRGRRQYRANHLEATKYDPAHESHLVLSELEHELAKSGAKVEDIDPELLDRTVEIVKRDGETDVLTAYERAIMEDAERYDATAHERQSSTAAGHIPGWDAADGGAAPRHGENGAGERGQAGRADQGARREDGAQSSRPGRGNRSTPAVVAADPRWRQLADATPDFNAPEVLAESEYAAQTPEPASVQPQKSLSALEKAAADAEEVWRQVEPTLTVEERQAINDLFANQQIDKDVKDRMIVDGVTCLMGAIA